MISCYPSSSEMEVSNTAYHSNPDSLSELKGAIYKELDTIHCKILRAAVYDVQHQLGAALELGHIHLEHFIS